MSLDAIIEQLRGATGVGVALLDLDTLRFRFQNDTFTEWFGPFEPSETLADRFPDLPVSALAARLAGDGRDAVQASLRLRRPSTTVTMQFSRAFGGAEPIVVVICQSITRIKELESMIDSYAMMVKRNARELKRDKEQVERLLLTIMPRAALEEYRVFGAIEPRVYEPVTVLSLEFTGFADLVERHEPGVIVSEMNEIYGAFNQIGEQFGCKRITTEGGLYVAVSGMPDPLADHANATAHSAIRYLRYLSDRNLSHPITWRCRIGIATGRLIGSVVGVQNHIYDAFGPAVYHAGRLREFARPMAIVVNDAFAAAVADAFDLEILGTLDFDATGATVHRLIDARDLAKIGAA